MQINDAPRSRNRSVMLGVICLLLQIVLSPHIGLGNGRINFAIVYCGIVALGEGGRRGVLAGFVAGLAFDLLSTGPIGLMSGLLSVMGYALGTEERNRFADGQVAPLTSYGVASLLSVVLYHLTTGLLSESVSLLDLVFLRALPTFALTFVAFLPFALAEARAAGKGLGGPRQGGLRGSHYDLRGVGKGSGLS